MRPLVRVIAALLAGAALACPGRPSARKDDAVKDPRDPQGDCARAAAAFARRDFASLRGLPSTCRLADLAPHLASTGRGTTGRLGEPDLSPVARTYELLDAEGFPDPPRGWLDGDRVVLVDADDPPAPDGFAPLSASLGPPDAKLDYPWDVLVLPEAEWVYAARGLAIAFNPDNGIVLHVALFAPTTVDTYRRELRLVHEYREEP